MSQFHRPAFHESELPERIVRSADREMAAAHEQTVTIGNWLLVHSPKMGRQIVYLAVATRDIDVPVTNHSGD